MKFAYLNFQKTPNNVEEFLIKQKIEFCKYNVLDQLMISNENYSAIICDYTEYSEFTNIKKIRSSEKFYFIPILLNEKSDLNFFIDGCIFDLNSISKTVKINNLMTKLKEFHYVNWNNRLLTYLYTRPDYLIKPQKSWKNKYYYYYPLLEIFCPENENYMLWINNLIERNIFECNESIDTFFVCRKCFSPHLKMTPHCPACGSMNVATESFLHCFTCGLSAPEKDFYKEEKLMCPNCHSKLKLKFRV